MLVLEALAGALRTNSELALLDAGGAAASKAVQFCRPATSSWLPSFGAYAGAWSAFDARHEP
jgi:hypothetical protein